MSTKESTAASSAAPESERAIARDKALTDALEGMRTRLTLLATSLADYQHLVASENPMPAPEKLQAKAAQVSSNMAVVTGYLAERHAVFAEANVFPLPSYPGRAEGGMLAALLRKKLDPRVEDWLDEGWEGARDGATGAGANGSGSGNGSGHGITVREWQEAWRGLSKMVAEAIYERGAGLGVVDYTKAEMEMGVENVRTGLKRKLVKMPKQRPVKADAQDGMDIEMEDDDDEDDEDEDDDEEESGEEEDGAGEAKQGEPQAPVQTSMSISDYLRITLGMQNPATGDLVINGIAR